MDIVDIRTKITPVLKKHGVSRASVFGSVARGEAGPESDLDLLIELSAPVGVYGLVRLKHELEEVAKRPVDVVTRGALNKHLAPFVEGDLVSIL